MSTVAEAHHDGQIRPSETKQADTADTPETVDDLPVTVIERQPGWRIVDLGELWRYRELLFFLTWRDIKVRSKQTVLGAVWAILQPFATMIVFSVFFNRMASSSSDVPYPLFVFAGLLPWTFFATALSSAGQSLVGSQSLVTKVYFPRMIIPVGSVGAGVVDFVIAFGMLLALMLFFGVPPGWGILLTPFLALGLLVAALGVGLILSALTVSYRDFRYIIPFMVQFWMFATPSIYLQAESGAASRWQHLLPLNPAYGLIANFRQAALGGAPDLYSLAVSGGVSLLLLLIGCFWFRKLEHNFADVI